MMLTVEQVAEKLVVSENTVHNLIRRGALVAVQVGKQFRIEPQEFDRFLRSNRTANHGQGAA